MVDIAWVKRWPDGREVVVAGLTDKEARVRIGGEYRVLPIEQWRTLPLFDGEKLRA